MHTVDAREEELVEFRRDLHARPELSWRETRTSARVLAQVALEVSP